MPLSEQSPGTTNFDRVAARLLAASEAQENSAIPSEDYRIALRTLTRFARGFVPSEADAEDVAAAAIAEACAPRDDPTTSAVRKAGAYLFWITRNRARDLRRRVQLHGGEVLVENFEAGIVNRYYSQEDDEISQLLDRDASAALLEDALRAAKAAGDDLVERVVTAWLDLAEDLGSAPSSRDVEREVGVSHTSVNNALQRLRAYFPAP